MRGGAVRAPPKATSQQIMNEINGQGIAVFGSSVVRKKVTKPPPTPT
jgi:hypothetical protein